MNERTVLYNRPIICHNDVALISVKDHKIRNLMIWGLRLLANKTETKISFNEIIKIANLKKTIRPKQIIEFLNTFKIQMESLDLTNLSRNIKNSLFNEIEINPKYKYLKLIINPECSYLNSNLTEKYFSVDFNELLYLKDMEQRLLLAIIGNRYIGHINISYKEMKKILFLNFDYSVKTIKKRFIDKAINELKNDFTGLRCTISDNSDDFVYRFSWDAKTQLENRFKEIDLKNKQAKKFSEEQTKFNLNILKES
jgi:hypothetical protein